MLTRSGWKILTSLPNSTSTIGTADPPESRSAARKRVLVQAFISPRHGFDAMVRPGIVQLFLRKRRKRRRIAEQLRGPGRDSAGICRGPDPVVIRSDIAVLQL